MDEKENQLPELDQRLSSRLQAIVKTVKEKKKFKLIEKRACSSLAELSNSICQNLTGLQNYQDVKTTNFSLFSPWKNHLKQDQEEKSAIRNKRSTLYELQQLKKGRHCLQRRRETSKIQHSFHRHRTEANELLNNTPKLLFSQSIIDQQKQSGSLGILKGKTYTSHQVLHISRPSEQCYDKGSKSSKKHKLKQLCLNQAKIECKPYFKDLPNKENTRFSILNKLAENQRNQRVITLKCSKNKKLKRMFMDNKNPQRQSGCSKQPSAASLHLNPKNFTGSNPVSRTLLEKYLLLVSDQNNKQHYD